jgi:hypothetical protein
MKRTLMIFLLGLAAGVGAHYGWLATDGGRRNAGDLGGQLAWMQASLHLDETQLARIKRLHEDVAPRLLALAGQVESMREELAAFERTREAEGRIDFLEFARFVEERRKLDRECARSTEQLVAASAAVMTPRQREQYLSLLEPALKTLRTSTSG